MSHTTAHQQSRREMFRSTLRYLALGGISLGSAGLIARAVTSPAEDGCRRHPVRSAGHFELPPTACRGCAAITHCRLPQASAARKHGKT